MAEFMARISPLLFGGVLLLLAGCGPDYPKCENDGHCSEKGEYCVNGLCQQCRTNDHCGADAPYCSGGKCVSCASDANCAAGFRCSANSCVEIPGYCDADKPCGPGQMCRDNRCVEKPECGEGADNPTCAEGSECVGGRCQAIQVSCDSDAAFFDYDRYNIRRDQRGKLDTVAECMKGNPAPDQLTLEGHCDERGTEEYNLALGERRAEAVKRYLSNVGVDSAKLNTISYGESRPSAYGSNEESWSKNRRVEFR